MRGKPRSLHATFSVTAILLFVIANAVLAWTQKTTTQSWTLQYEYTPRTPASTEGLSFAFPTVGLFIGVSNYKEQAKVTSTPAHALGAAVMYQAFVDAATRTGTNAFEIPAQNYFSGGEDAICALVFSPDGSYFATGSKDGTVKIWPGTKTGEVVGSSSHKSNACALAFSPDSSQLVTGGSEGDAVIQSLGAHKTAITLKHPAGVCSVAFSPSGSRILSTSLDGTTRIWEPAKTVEAVALPPGQDCPPEKRQLQSCADGPVAVFGTDDKTVVTASCSAVRVWNLDNPGESILLGKESAPIRGLSLSVDGSKLLSVTDDGVSLWRIGDTTGKPLIGRDPSARNARFSPDGTSVAVGLASGAVNLYRNRPKMEQMEGTASLGPYVEGVKSLQFSQNGKYLLANSNAGIAWMRDVAGAERPIAVPRPDEKGHSGMTIKFAIDQGTIPYGRARAGTEVVAFSPDATYVVAGYENGQVGIHPGVGPFEQKVLRLDNQVLLGDLKFDKTATSIMAIWYLEQLRGASDQMTYTGHEGPNDLPDPSLLQLGQGEPVTRERIFKALSAALEKAERIGREQGLALLVVYVAAHGWIGPDGRQYLLPSDADQSKPGTWIAYEDFLDPIRAFLKSQLPTGNRDPDPHKVALVIFDTCQIRLTSSHKASTLSFPDDPMNLAVVESTSPGQYAWHWTGNLNSTEMTTTTSSKSRFGITHHSGPTQDDTKSEYSARMSMFPFASQWALNALIQQKGSNSRAEERKISLADWMAYTQETIRQLQDDIPEVKETGYTQTVRFRNPKQPDFTVFEVDKNAPAK